MRRRKKKKKRSVAFTFSVFNNALLSRFLSYVLSLITGNAVIFVAEQSQLTCVALRCCASLLQASDDRRTSVSFTRQFRARSRAKKKRDAAK